MTTARVLDRDLIFIKLGGSLITDKDRTETARVDLIRALLGQLKQQLFAHPELKVVLGHGSGSFGHHAAKKFATRNGVFGEEDWLGYQAVWQSARKLNQIVVEQSQAVGLPVIAFPPSAAIVTDNHTIVKWDLAPMRIALSHNLIPIVYGDVASDLNIGGTILSTEDLFFHLAQKFHPGRILLAGMEKGVYADYPHNREVLPFIASDANLETRLEGSASVDVTGGMVSKVSLMQAICRAIPGIQIHIFSGTDPANLGKAIEGLSIGTLIA
ncbi:MAG: isopentenyl phosphate kinase [Anaerolineaceae bacterium]